jgi:RimJ/RimL family protein N-acetyltransferase
MSYFWEGKKIRLRPLLMSDWEAGYKAFLDSESRRFLQLEIELPKSEEMFRNDMARMCNFSNPGTLMFTIETLSGEVAGVINIHSLNLKNGTFSPAVVIFEGCRQKGYADEAMRIILRYAFYELRYQKCNSVCMDTNAGSENMHKKLGFIREGRRRRVVYTNGEYHDELIFGLTREEFDENEKQYKSS